MSTVAEVATRALGDEFDSGFQADAERMVREAVSLIYRQTNLARGGILLGVVTVPGAYTVTGLAVVESLRLAGPVFRDLDGAELEELEAADWRSLVSTRGSETGPPQAYAFVPTAPIAEPTFQLWPKADIARTVWVGGQGAVLANDLQSADAVPLPEVYERLLVAHARGELFALESDREMSDFWVGRWQAGTSELRSDLQRRRNRNRQVPGTWSGLSSGAPAFHYRGLF
jgi:hypothetical protein